MMLLPKGRPLNPVNPQIPGYLTITVSLIRHSNRRTMALISVHAARGEGREKEGRGGALFFLCSRTPRRDMGWSAEGNDVFPSQKETHWQKLQKTELQIQVPRMKMRGRQLLLGDKGRRSITFNWKMRDNLKSWLRLRCTNNFNYFFSIIALHLIRTLNHLHKCSHFSRRQCNFCSL